MAHVTQWVPTWLEYVGGKPYYLSYHYAFGHIWYSYEWPRLHTKDYRKVGWRCSCGHAEEYECDPATARGEWERLFLQPIGRHHEKQHPYHELLLGPGAPPERWEVRVTSQYEERLRSHVDGWEYPAREPDILLRQSDARAAGERTEP